MPSLRELQAGFQRAILSRQPPPSLDPDPVRRYRERFASYADGYRIRLAAALRANFPVLHRVLGDEAFGALAAAFVEAEPSTTPSIRWFGRRLPAFVAEHPEVLPHPALADLVAMEWALGIAFDAADAPPIAAADLAGVAPEDWHALRFTLHPSVAILELQWQVEPIFRALKPLEGAAGDEPQLPEPSPQHHVLLAWRDGLEARWRTLAVDNDEVAALRRLEHGARFGDLCADLARTGTEAAAARRAAALLGRWVHDGMLSAR